MDTSPESTPGIFLGIDWGGSEHQLCAVNTAGEVVLRQRVEHTCAGLSSLDEVLDGYAGAGVVVGIERAEGLLVERLQAREVPVYCISPKISARARERYRLANTKSDKFDAFVLADSLRHEHRHWRPLSVPSQATALVAAFSRDRERVVVMQRAVESRLRATLETYHPAPLHLFSSLDRDIALAFIRDYPTPELASRIGPARMARFCRRHGYSGRVPPELLVERLRPHLLASSAGSTAGKSVTALHLVDQLALLNAQQRDYDKRLAAAVAAHPDGPIFTSVPGVGAVITGVFIGELGDDRSRFPHPGVLLAEAGLAPVTRASGRTRQVRFRYAANKHLRHAIDWWMTVAAREDPWSHAVYEAYRAAGQGRFRAYRGLGARWTRILWRAWTDHRPYDPTRASHTLAT
jgi:transposase